MESRPRVKDRIPNIEKSTDAFVIFVYIYLQKFPEKNVDLLQYMSIIRDGAEGANILLGVPTMSNSVLGKQYTLNPGPG